MPVNKRDVPNNAPVWCISTFTCININVHSTATECNDHGVLVANSTQLCECESPYIGNHCQYCSNGYYGDPRYVYIQKIISVELLFYYGDFTRSHDSVYLEKCSV